MKSIQPLEMSELGNCFEGSVDDEFAIRISVLVINSIEIEIKLSIVCFRVESEYGFFKEYIKQIKERENTCATNNN